MDWSICTGDKTSNGVPTLSCIPYLFSHLIYYAFLFAGAVAVIIIIWAGIKYIRSGGDAKQTQSARQTLTFAVIGLIIILSSVFIVNFISLVTNVPCIKNFGFTSCKS